jgi:hypothetical protein
MESKNNQLSTSILILLLVRMQCQRHRQLVFALHHDDYFHLLLFVLQCQQQCSIRVHINIMYVLVLSLYSTTTYTTS